MVYLSMNIKGIPACPIIWGHQSNIITVKPGYSVLGLVETSTFWTSLKEFLKRLSFIFSIYIVESGYSGQILSSGRVPLYRGLTVSLEVISPHLHLDAYTLKQLH